MVRLSYILKPRWELFRRHDLRLRTHPDPLAAREMFKKRLVDAKRWQKARITCFLGIYFSAIVTTIGAIVATLGNVRGLEAALGTIAGLVSSLALLFILGVFIATRVLGYIEVDLYFYSEESRQQLKQKPSKASRATETEPEEAETGTDAEVSSSRRKRRVYTRPPASSYRP